MRWLKKVLTGGAKKEREREHRSKEQSAVVAPPMERRRWSFSKARKSITEANRRPSATVVVVAGELSQAKPCSCGAQPYETEADVLIQKAFRGYMIEILK